ncbi:MAG TPA: bifunctional methionine sulfoxide reductase B/A protein [Candidatus Aminicenantes bacterium]|nr:bifunctional methionine sulfoxide reductase B/A protein [Candidatus Aminicenantes bacterium]HRY65810.1 bifunctional methionine sulfoxide reductase B/A protein [Candidatus Aminicenantes bacterium]HRZ72724.1 bifunctional methionine sulfoxide reductase B/A protein [Candidatus Aminicenantes bacterium]
MPARVRLAVFALAVGLGLAGWRGLEALAGLKTPAALPASQEGPDMPAKVKKSEKEWKAALTPEQFDVMRKCGTERPFTGRYDDFWDEGVYVCAGCGTPLFLSAAKYQHGTGWPSFSKPADEKNIEYRDDYALLVKRVEVRCAACGAHLGHVFDDGPEPTFLHYCINSAALGFKPAAAAQEGPSAADAAAETATFAAGCFWGVEHKLGQIPGVVSTVVGYTGGRTENPTYEQVSTGRTGHAEAVQVVFDPARLSYEELVRSFFRIHDPTQVNRQGPDRGTQYRSAIFYHSQAQKETALRVMDELAGPGRRKKRLATEVVPAGPFTKAEENHQKYFEKHGFVCD